MFKNKRLFIQIAACLLCLLGYSMSSAEAEIDTYSYYSYERCSSAVPNGGVDYFPWSLARPFPWKDIQGIWSSEFNEVTTYFSFRVVRVGTNGKQLRIVRYNDLTSCFVLAKGTGHESNNQVNAQLVGAEGRAFRMAVGSFNSEDLPKDLKCDSPVMGMRLSNFVNMGNRKFSNPHISTGTMNAPEKVKFDLMSSPIYKISDKTSCKQLLDK